MIERVKQDGQSLLYADRANELIDAINALNALSIANGLGTVTVTDGNVVIDLSPLFDSRRVTIRCLVQADDGSMSVETVDMVGTARGS